MMRVLYSQWKASVDHQNRNVLNLLVALLLVAVCDLASAASLQIAAAADLAVCMQELNAAFSTAHAGAEIKSNIGSSGAFFAQITNGAPFDVFLSADLDYPRALALAGKADAATLVVYAHGQLVLFSADPSVSLAQGFKAFDDPRIKRIAIANPDIAPYGRAARAALQHAGVWNTVQTRLVFGENIAQTAQFVTTGNAQAGLVSSAQAGQRDSSAGRSVWIVPPDWYPTIEQGGIVTAYGKSNPLAREYLAFLQNANGRTILHRYGFTLPTPRQ